MRSARPVILVILDGWGIGPPGPTNAVHLARTPCLAAAAGSNPQTTLVASGRAVGLREGLMGNSEVGHLNLGAGRVVPQDIVRIDDAIADGSLFVNPALRQVFAAARAGGRRVHLVGLIGSGGVHADEGHYLALLEMACREGFRGDRLAFHAITDGRDTPPRSAVGAMKRLVGRMRELGTGRVVSVSGRYWAMDRDRRWERTERAYRTMFRGESGDRLDDPVAACEASYASGVTDEFIAPLGAGAAYELAGGDGLIFFNFRADRARQLTSALVEESFDGFERGCRPRLHAATMTPYREDLPVPYAFADIGMEGILGEVLAAHGLTQLRVGETEKYAHVSYFFNGGRETPFEGEERVLVPSPKVATYDLAPEMSAAGVANAAASDIDAGGHDFYVVNFANPDMVGHTGVLAAAVRGVEAADAGLGRVLAAAAGRGAAVLVTADHGNAEAMIDPATGGPHTYHTTNPVPFVLVGGGPGAKLAAPGRPLASVAPTVLELFGIARPAAMTGASLLGRDSRSAGSARP